jgi:hypothetical protein
MIGTSSLPLTKILAEIVIEVLGPVGAAAIMLDNAAPASFLPPSLRPIPMG